jgi:thiol-disulfide isomerase/thioredoxin
MNSPSPTDPATRNADPAHDAEGEGSQTRRALIFAGAGLAACAAGGLGGWWWLNHGAVPGEESKLLAASFEDLSGKPTPLATWRGKTRLINFWATWCAPCREEMPEFVIAQNRYAERGLQIIGIAIDRKPPVERFVREIGVNYPILMGDPAWLEEVKTMGNPQGVLPFSMVIGPDDRVMLRRVGMLKLSEISAIFT